MNGPPRPAGSPLARLRAQVGRLGKELLERRRQTEQLMRDHRAQHEELGRNVDVDVTQHSATTRGLESHVHELSGAWRRHSAKASKFIDRVPRTIVDEQDVMDRLERIAAGTRPILVGPWTGEVGFELLYWIPFVRWFVEHYGVDRGRLHVVSRGGPVSWYQDLTSSYSDILTHYSPEEFRGRTAEQAWAKQHQFRPFDREIVRHTLRGSSRRHVWLLHPSLMYRRFKGYWGNRLSLRHIMSLMSHRRPQTPPAVPGLPTRYVAVRFYFSTCFPDTVANRTIIGETLDALMRQTDVVFLNTGFRVDDHYDFSPESAHRLHTIDHLITPERNLELQSAVIARADAFVGSYGGLSYLPPLFGVPSVALYSDRVFKSCHLDLANLIYAEAVPGKLTVLDVADLGLLRRALVGRAPVPVSSSRAASPSS